MTLTMCFLLYHVTAWIHVYLLCYHTIGFPVGLDGRESACNTGDPGSIPGSGRPPGEGNGNHFSILAWRIPWTEEPGGLQSVGVAKS